MFMTRMMSRLMLMILTMMMEGVLMKAVMGEVYQVGGSNGWTILGNSSYIAWKSSKRFHVGDTLCKYLFLLEKNLFITIRKGV